MAGVAEWLDSRTARSALRRSLPRSYRLTSCQSAAELEAVLQRRLIDAIVLGTWTARRMDLPGFQARFPTIPIVLFGAVRPEDSDVLVDWGSQVGLLLIEGVDEAIVGELVERQGASRRRLAARSELPRLCRLSEPLQQRAWDCVAASPGRPPGPARVARTLRISREHLSRQFGAGGAPNLKQLADLLTVQVALELLGNPGYAIRTVARLLEFSGPSHLRTTIRRTTGQSLAEARRLPWTEVVRRFLRLTGRQ
jgi:AraC-like DNA-binding protein